MRKILTLLTVLMLGILTAHAQSRTITGKVVDSAGAPVDGASVVVKGTSRGTASNAAGVFTLAVNGNVTLTVSAVNFRSTNVEVGSQTSVAVTLYASASNLSEVVVTTGLGIQRQAKSLGYGTAKLSSSEVSQTKPISVANGLTGKVSGLQINTINNGLFAPTRITLRGERSLTGNNQPLIVVDGSIYYSDLSTLNPDDIQDYSILKGSSASAVYGSDASNGVIIITTKKGNRGKANLAFSTTTQLETVSYMPSYQSRFGSNGGEKFVNDFNDLSTFIPYENQSYGPEFNGKLVPLGRPVSDGTVLTVPYSAVKNQKRDFFNTGLTEQNNLSLQSGDENGSTFISLQDIVSKAIMPGDKGRRDVFRIGGTKKYGILSASYNMAYTYKHTNTTNTGNVYYYVIETPLEVPLSSLRDVRHNKFADPNGYFNDYYPSPYEIIADDRNYSTENHVTGNVAFNLKPFNWLTLTYRSAVDNTGSRFEYHAAQVNYSNYALTSPTVIYSNPAGTGFDTVSEAPKYYAGADNPHFAQYGTSQLNNFLFNTDFLASVNKDFAKDFNVNGTIGSSYLDNKINYTPINNGTLNFPVYNTQNYRLAPNVAGQGIAEARKLGFFGEATIGYKGAVYVHGSYRTDIDSRLSKDNRWIPYYDVDGAVVLSQLAPAITNNKVLDYAKVRYAHSLTGNVSALANGSQYIAFGAYQTTPTLGAAPGFPYSGSGISGYSLTTTVANPSIKPESVVEDEVGLDLGLFKDRISLTGSAYISTTSDGIVYASVSSASGYNRALVNAAKTRNKGIELDLKPTIIRTKNTTWNVGVNWTHEVSKVLSIAGNVPSLGLAGNGIVNGNTASSLANGNSYAVVNLPYPQIATYDWVRDPTNGKVIVDAVSGLPTRSSTLSYLGQANPKDILGFTTNITWKNFAFAATADYRAGYKIFNSIGEIMDHSGVGSTTAVTGRQRFVFPNSEYADTKGGYVANTNVEVNDANFNFWPSLYNSVGANYVISAAAWKLREVVITYNIPVAILGNQKLVKKAAFSVSGRNLLMIRPSTNKWTDPEFSEDTGNDVGRTSENQAPPTRLFSGTLSITF